MQVRCTGLTRNVAAHTYGRGGATVSRGLRSASRAAGTPMHNWIKLSCGAGPQAKLACFDANSTSERLAAAKHRFLLDMRPSRTLYLRPYVSGSSWGGLLCNNYKKAAADPQMTGCPPETKVVIPSGRPSERYLIPGYLADTRYGSLPPTVFFDRIWSTARESNPSVCPTDT